MSEIQASLQAGIHWYIYVLASNKKNESCLMYICPIGI